MDEKTVHGIKEEKNKKTTYSKEYVRFLLDGWDNEYQNSLKNLKKMKKAIEEQERSIQIMRNFIKSLKTINEEEE